jgi:RimJ/RimL family protein N-acetyltransferase
MIRKATTSDFEFIHDLYMHQDINPYLLYPVMDSDSFKPVFNELIEKGIKYVYIDSEGKPAGMFKLIPLTFRNDHIAYLGGLAIHPSFAGKGHARHMLQEILLFAKRIGIRRIELSTATINQKAIRLYERAGFEKEGILRKYTYLEKEDKYLDEVMMSYLF